MRLRARARLLRMRITRRWREEWRPAVDLGTISREKMYEIEARIRANVVRDRRGNEWPARNALVLALLVSGLLACPFSADAAESARFRAYKQWTLHYQHVMGLDDVKITFVKYHHPKWCAWVDKTKTGDVLVGFSEPDWGCYDRKPQELALHEMCHLRLKHLELPAMSDEEKHAEVRKCISDYYWRDRE